MTGLLPPRPRRWWVVVLGALVLLPVLGCLAVSVLVGVRTRAASSRVRGWCARYAVGGAVEVGALGPSRPGDGLTVTVRPTTGGGSLVEARAGVLTASYVCVLEVAGGRVTSSRFSRED